MIHTGVDIEQVICVTSTLLRGVSIKLKQSNVGPSYEEQCQYLYGHKSYHEPMLVRTVSSQAV